MPESLPTTCEAFGHPCRPGPAVTSPVAGAMEILNDEVMINAPSDRPCGTMRMKLRYSGRSTPLPAEGPWAEGLARL